MFWPGEIIPASGLPSTIDNYNLDYAETYTGTSAHPRWTGTCNGHSLETMSVTVRSPNRAVVDLNKMLCYLPEDCAPRRLKIDKARWDSYAADVDKRWTD